jgi:hypothetical protein
MQEAAARQTRATQHLVIELGHAAEVGVGLLQRVVDAADHARVNRVHVAVEVLNGSTLPTAAAAAAATASMHASYKYK